VCKLGSSIDLFSGLSIDKIFEKPGPYYILYFILMINITFDILSCDSLKGSLFHGRNSACTPSKLTMFFSQEAQEKPPSGFLVNIASSSCPLPVPYSSINSNNYFNYNNDNINPYLFFNLSNFLGNFPLISKPIDHILNEFIEFLSDSPLKTLDFSFISLLVNKIHEVIKLFVHHVP
jgi:hypothetical protein